MSNQNIPYNGRQSGVSRREDLNYKSPESSIYTQKQSQSKNDDGFNQPSSAYRSMKFPDQINFN